MPTKADKDKLAAGAADIKKAQADKSQSKVAMEIHPVAKMFPTLPAKEMRELKASIEENGIEVPILVNRAKNTIIDGRNRWMVALDLGLSEKDIPMEVFKGSDDEIPNVVLMRNVFRRHLTPDQRVAMITKVMAPQLEAEAAERKAKKGTFGAQSTDGKKGTVAEQVAKKAEVSEHKGRQAVRALKTGQLDQVIEKKKTLKQADKDAPKAKPAKAPKTKPFEDIVWDRWDKFLKSFDHKDRAQVKVIVRGILIEDKSEAKKS